MANPKQVPAWEPLLADGPVMRYTLPVPPSANRWWRSLRTVTSPGRVIKSKEARAYLAALRLPHRDMVREGPVVVTLVWFALNKRGDLDKRIPVVLDLLQGQAYANDRQVEELHAYRRIEHGNPRVEVAVQRLVPAAQALSVTTGATGHLGVG